MIEGATRRVSGAEVGLAGIVFLARAVDGARVAPPSVRTAGWGADALTSLGTSVLLPAML